MGGGQRERGRGGRAGLALECTFSFFFSFCLSFVLSVSLVRNSSSAEMGGRRDGDPTMTSSASQQS